MVGFRRWFGVLLIGLLIAPPTASAARTRHLPAQAGLEDLGFSCAAARSSDGVSYTRCSGQVASFDGLRLDTDVFLPRRGRMPFPTILMLHGWSGSKRDWQAGSKDGGASRRKQQWNNVWFASRGYAVVNYTARGFHESCGRLDHEANCSRGWTHLAERDFEIRDSQHLLGLLVDAGVADVRRLAATGGSYGGGQAWLLATSLPWRSPAGRRLQLAAAVPQYAWTDLLHALMPNGRASDDRGQTRSHEVPLGVAKASYISGLYVAGRTLGRGRYNTLDASEFHSALDAQYALVQAGEPYGTPEIARRFARTYRNKSAYYAAPYFAALRAGRAEAVPVLSVQGWTDPLFPAVETLQMYRKLQGVDDDYPLYVIFGDIGHPNARNRASEWRHVNGLANRFLDRFVLEAGAEPPARVSSFTTSCASQMPPRRPLSAPRWDALARGKVRALGDASRASAWPGESTGGAASDPLLNAGRCIRRRARSFAPSVSSWTWRVPTAFTLAGLPEINVSYRLSGVDATAVFKLWDVDRAGYETLVDRGVYRLSRAAGDRSSGTIDLDLFGNAWRFAPGHLVRLEVGQADAPFLRPDNLPSAIQWSRLRLRLPVLEPSRVTLRAARGGQRR